MTWMRALLCLCLSALVPLWLPLAHAHDPLDGSLQLMVYQDRLEATVTLGQDAAKQFLHQSHVAEPVIDAILHPRDSALVNLPPLLAAGLVTVGLGDQSLTATRFVAAPSELEVRFLVELPRPHLRRVQVYATYFGTVSDMRAGPLTVGSQVEGKLLSNQLLSPRQPTASVALTSDAASPAAATATFGAFFTLGMEHILSGTDHLLFLGALLLGVRRLRQMLGIITAFTLAHSLTLALAAWHLVALPSRIVEPMIAASIIVACLFNLLRGQRELGTGSRQYLLTACFGLIHGLAFADGLREKMSASPEPAVVLPLLGFNLGIESGQLLVAAAVLPLLFLLRHQQRLAARVEPVLGWTMVVLATVWLAQRLVA